ncbi:MAG: response regulator transcription factor [Ferruginibacter sp.]
MSEVRVLIVEDEPIIAEDIAASLKKNDFLVTGICYTAVQAEKQLTENLPDIVLLDINLKNGEEGIELAKKINAGYKIPFVFLTSYSDSKTLQQAKSTGPSGYIVKPFSSGGLYATLEVAIHNYAQQHKIKFPELDMQQINQNLLTKLSDREFEVLQLIYNGITNRQIAEQIFVSVNTIKKHINNAYLKIDATTRTNAITRLRELMLK